MASKAWSAGNHVYMYTETEDTAKKLDDLLWTFRDISFVPHEIYNGTENNEVPITIGFGNHFPNHSQVMINLDYKIPEFAEKFSRIIEIVENNEKNKEIARQRYRQYKESEYELYNHNIDNLKEIYQTK
jgi:DNA polymerase-3 subunit chi